VDICKVLDETLALRDYDLKVNDIQVEREIEAGFPPSPPTHTNWNRCFSTSSTMAWTPCWKSAGRIAESADVRPRRQCHRRISRFRSRHQEPNRIFDPFYTTKSVGKGTVSASIVTASSRSMGRHFRAQPGNGGAVIEVRLPGSGRAGAVEPVVPVPPRKLVIEGSVLLVEDEEAVLEFERDVLAGAGAQVATLMSFEEVKARLLQPAADAASSDAGGNDRVALTRG